MELLQCVSNNEPRSRGFSLGRSPKMSSGQNRMIHSEERDFQVSIKNIPLESILFKTNSTARTCLLNSTLDATITSRNIFIEFAVDRILVIRANLAVQFNTVNQFKKLVKIVETLNCTLLFLWWTIMKIWTYKIVDLKSVTY